MTRKIGAYSAILTATPAISTDIYADGDLIGSAEISLPLAVRADGLAESSGIIQAVIITDLAAQGADIDVYFFDRELANTTFTDNAAWDISDVDLLTLIGVAAIIDWRTLNDNSNGQLLNLGLPFVIPANATALFAVIVSRGTPTYVTSLDLTLRVAILQD